MKTYIVQVEIARTTYKTVVVSVRAPDESAAIDGASDFTLARGETDGRSVVITKDREVSAYVSIYNADVAPDVVVDELGREVK